MKRLIFCIPIIILWACQDVKRPEKPENLIPKDKMVEVLADAYVSEAARSTARINIINNGLSLDSLFYASHNIDSLQFVNSNAYYTSQVDVYLDILDRVQNKLKEKQSSIDSLRNEELEEREEEAKEKIDVENTEDSLAAKPKLLSPKTSISPQDSLE